MWSEDAKGAAPGDQALGKRGKLGSFKRKITRQIGRSRQSQSEMLAMFRIGSVKYDVKKHNHSNMAANDVSQTVCARCPISWPTRRAGKSGDHVGATGSTLTVVTSKGKRKNRFVFVEPKVCKLSWCSIGIVGYAVKTLYFGFIQEVRTGPRTPNFERMFQGRAPTATDCEKCFSIVYKTERGKGDLRTLDLICENVQQREHWVSQLVQLLRVFSTTTRTGDLEADYAMFQWHKLGVADHVLRPHLHRQLKSMNLEVGRRFVMRKFAEFDANLDRALQVDEFCELISSLGYLIEWQGIFDAYASSTTNLISFESFGKFLSDVQGEELGESGVRAAFEKFNKQSSGIQSDRALAAARGQTVSPPVDGISFNGFVRYLFSSINNVVGLSERESHEDLGRPLCEYYILSSHNTYLTGDQLMSTSSVDMYIRAFRAGVRSVELDLFDGPEGKPIITHGHTITSVIPAEAVIEAVRDYGFTPPLQQGFFGPCPSSMELPIIISLENHLSVEQQRVLVSQFRTILGEMLALPESESVAILRSPADLKGKVLLKGKCSRRKPSVAAGSKKSQDHDGDIFEDPEFEAMHQSTEGKKNLGTGNPGARSTHDAQEASQLPSKFCKELSEIIYLEAVKIKSWDDSWENAPASCMSSFGDSKLNLFLRSREKVVRYNKKQLSRIYPSATRESLLKSANYDPMPFWALGCQLVSMNIQTNDKGLRLAKAMFQNRNGGCGYIPKPAFLLGDSDGTVQACEMRCQVQVEVISAHRLPKPTYDVIDPFVTLEIHGVDADKASARTRTVRNNGFNPVFKEEFTFELTCADLALMYVEVWDEDITTTTTSVAYGCVPVAKLRNGYRNIKLHDPRGHELPFSSMMLRIAIKGEQERVLSRDDQIPSPVSM